MALSKNSIFNATEEQMRKRVSALQTIKSADIRYFKLYSNMSRGRLRVKLFGASNITFSHLTTDQLRVLTEQGFKRMTPAYSSAVSYVRFID